MKGVSLGLLATSPPCILTCRHKTLKPEPLNPGLSPGNISCAILAWWRYSRTVRRNDISFNYGSLWRRHWFAHILFSAGDISAICCLLGLRRVVFGAGVAPFIICFVALRSILILPCRKPGNFKAIGSFLDCECLRAVSPGLHTLALHIQHNGDVP